MPDSDDDDYNDAAADDAASVVSTVVSENGTKTRTAQRRVRHLLARAHARSRGMPRMRAFFLAWSSYCRATRARAAAGLGAEPVDDAEDDLDDAPLRALFTRRGTTVTMPRHICLQRSKR